MNPRALTRLLAAALTAGAMLSWSPFAQAQVTGVVTHTSATVKFRPGADPSDTGITVYDGQQLGEQLGDNTFGSGAAFASTSRIDDQVIEFQNGNAAGGTFTYLTSRTTVDISFTNDGDSAVTPSLHSTITPAGMGLFNSSGCLNDLTSCSANASFPGDFRDFQSFGPGGDTNDIAGASFLFRISGGGEVLYELQGTLGLAYDPVSNTNLLSSEFGAAATDLANFRLVSEPGSQREYSFAWDATDIDVNFPKGTLLLPGESSTLTYETVVTSFSRTQCYQQLTNACILAYSSFGDPIGRGGGTLPTFAALAIGESSDLSFGSFNFAYPTFSRGTLSYELLPPSAVPEPQTWAMMILGFGLIGGAIRRRRPVGAAHG